MNSKSTTNMLNSLDAAEKKMRHVLIIAYFFPPCAEGSVMRVRAFAKHLSNYQWQPFVLTVKDSHYLSFTKDEALIHELEGKIAICRTNTLEPQGKYVKSLQENVYGIRKGGGWFDRYFKGMLRTLYRAVAIPDEHILWLPYAIKHGLHLINNNRIDLLFVTTPPHSAAVIATILSHLSRKPLVWDVRDDWVDNPLFDVGPWHRQILARLLERWIVKNAASVICVTPESATAFRQRYPKQPATKFISISNGFDREEIVALQAKVQKERSAKLRLVYVGTLGTKRTPEGLFQALQDLAKEMSIEHSVQVDFYGYARQDFVDLSQKMKLDNVVRFHGFVSREKSLQELLLSDASLMIIPDMEGSHTAIPGKLYEYIGSRKFVLALCSLASAPARLVQETNIGIVAPQHDSSAIKQAILVMLERYKKDNLFVTIDDHLLKQFERSEQTRRLAEICNHIQRGTLEASSI
ncbi:MAG: glycosyltransferase [Caldilinea sp. CFX5]|nr:glycosyltransferase [Caldilinea sp. CFX5]